MSEDRVPWFADLSERVLETYAAPTLSRDEALDLLRIVGAARAFVSSTTIFRLRRDCRREFEALAIALLEADRRHANSHSEAQ